MISSTTETQPLLQLLIALQNLAKMMNEEGQRRDPYISRTCSATNRIITAKDHAYVQLNIVHMIGYDRRRKLKLVLLKICGRGYSMNTAIFSVFTFN
ncbi:hypothetical protein C5167_031041 [Papaver somniferum]|nr:hypothetical protein C5167_031041 [Papaver somniferum]